jgi:hypothetical protein
LQDKSAKGGLVTGLRGAKIAANAILGRSNYFQEAAALRQELSLHLLIRKFLNRFDNTDYDRLLDLLNEKTIRLLGRYNRDRAASIICRVLLAQPRLLSFAPLLSRAVWERLTRSRARAPRNEQIEALRRNI